VRLSVVIPNWNGREELAACLAALREQTVDELEVVVVDNASTDGSLEYVRDHHPEAITLRLPVNRGFAGGVNAGIEASSGEFVALLNNDAIAQPRWAEEMLAAMDHADVAASLMLERRDPEVVDSAGEQLSRWGLPYRHRRGERVAELALEGYPEIFAASGGASIYRRSVLEHVGVLDPQYFSYLEDVDLGFRARLAGYRVVLAPRARVLHGVGVTAGRLGHFQLHQFIKNSQLLVLKNVPLASLVKLAPRFAVVQAHLLVAATRRGALSVALRAYAANGIGLPMILLKRRRVQRLRTIAPSEIDALLTDHWPLDTDPVQKASAFLRARIARAGRQAGR
jgi:GT2 family glycosyltransferase